MYSTFAFGKLSTEGNFERITIKRNEPGDDDVQFDIVYCGICHTDVDFAENKRGTTKFPLVPGHELAGVVTKVGKNVKDIKVGDRVGAGCLSDSCLDCNNCQQNEEQFCSKGFTMTYNHDTKYGRIKTDSGFTYGGYSGTTTMHRRFVVKVPTNYPLEATGPVLCAGITMYSPLRHWGAVAGGLRVGIVGIGGLGQMGLRLAKTMGNTVVAISSSPGKKAAAIASGADEFLVSSDEAAMAAAANSLDLILNTVSAPHQLTTYLGLLRRDGTLVQLGINRVPHSVSQLEFLTRKQLSGSLIGGMKETQECLDFCAKHNIKPTTQLITVDKVGEVYERLAGGNDQVVRYVLDIKASA